MSQDSEDFFYYPRLTLLSRPQFLEPAHLQCKWQGPASDGERLSEFAGRLCYMSQSNPAGKSTPVYLGNILEQRHGSVLEHANYSILLEGVSRSLTHELVRHRAGFAYSQLSQRYVDESKVQFVIPPALISGSPEALDRWKRLMLSVRDHYQSLADTLMDRYKHIEDKTQRRKMAREAARSVLGNAAETKIVVTANARAWRTMLELRCGEGADAEIRRCMVEALKIMMAEAPAFFPDFEIYTAPDGNPAARVGHHKV